MRNYSTEHHRTKILPLRWIGNIFGEFAANHLMAVAYMDENEQYGFRYKYHGFFWKYLNKPWEWWGTYYTIDLDLMKDAWDEELIKDTLDQIGSDYDENGKPYWENDK
jgi:hypothetical protein